MKWILAPDSLREITRESEISYTYRFIAGSLNGCIGVVSKRFLSYACELGYQEIITNPLEAYAWECVINNFSNED